MIGWQQFEKKKNKFEENVRIKQKACTVQYGMRKQCYINFMNVILINFYGKCLKKGAKFKVVGKRGKVIQVPNNFGINFHSSTS